MSSFEVAVLDKALEIVAFESELLDAQMKGKIGIPVYLGIGQEYVASTLSILLARFNPAIFAQHRAHSYYIAFGGDKISLLNEILGDVDLGCARGYGGSVGIYSKDIPMFGHTGIMGEQAYLGAGWSLATNKPSLIVLGDATIEEDYVGPILGFASDRGLPTLFICEDNGLAVLTPTVKRRRWEAISLAKAYGLESHDLVDDPFLIKDALSNYTFEKPLFLNIRVQRKNRHVGALMEGEVQWDREYLFKEQFLKFHDKELYQQLHEKWLGRKS